MFRLKEKFSVFRNFSDQWNFSIEDCSALEYTNIFLQLSLDITFHAIECGVTTCPGHGESCHRWLSLIGEENIHRGLSGAVYRNKYGRREDSFQYLNNITIVLAAAISYSS